MTQRRAAVFEPLVAGANHRTSALAVRDRLFIPEQGLPLFLERLRGAGISQALVLSTCDRVEVHCVHDDHPRALQAILSLFADHAGVPAAELEGQVFALSGEAAVHHVFRVAASLDSQIVGEPEVLGQMKAAHRLAREAGMSGSELEAIFQSAYGAAKRVRSETATGERPVSIAAAVARIAHDLHGELSRSAALLVGGGDMGVLIARALKTGGLKAMTVVDTTEPRAEAAARDLDCHFAALAELPTLLTNADIVIASLGTRRHVLTRDVIQPAIARRRHKPIFVADIAVPGDAEPSVGDIEEVFLYNLDDLERVATAGLLSREEEAKKAVAIVDAELAAFWRDRRERGAIPTMTRLRQQFEAARQEAVAESGGDAERATRILVSRLLHGPTRTLRDIAAQGEAGQTELNLLDRVLLRLFARDPAVDVAPDPAERSSQKKREGESS
jgi:glutamyl-tRNA reductase